MQQNRDTLIQTGTNDSFTLTGTHNGVAYTLTVDQGRVVQFYPDAIE